MIECIIPPGFLYDTREGRENEVVRVHLPRFSLGIIANSVERIPANVGEENVTLLGSSYGWTDFNQQVERFVAPHIMVRVSVGEADRIPDERREEISYQLTSRDLGHLVRAHKVPVYEGTIESSIGEGKPMRFQAHLSGIIEKGENPVAPFRMRYTSEEVYDVIVERAQVLGGVMMKTMGLAIGCVPPRDRSMDPKRHGIVILRRSVEHDYSPIDVLTAALLESKLPQAAARALTSTGLMAFYAWIRAREEGCEISFPDFAPDYKAPVNATPTVEREQVVEDADTAE